MQISKMIIIKSLSHTYLFYRVRPMNETYYFHHFLLLSHSHLKYLVNFFLFIVYYLNQLINHHLLLHVICIFPLLPPILFTFLVPLLLFLILILIFTFLLLLAVLFSFSLFPWHFFSFLLQVVFSFVTLPISSILVLLLI